MDRHDRDDDWIDELQHRQGFVLDESLSGMVDAEPDVVYRRAHVATEFVTSARFESLNDSMFETAPGKVAFASAPAGLDDLDDGMGVFQPVAPKGSSAVDSSSLFSFSTAASEIVIPTGEVPDAREVGYLLVNPRFESRKPAPVIFETLQRVLKERDIDAKCSPEWTIQAYAVVAAEELFFSVELHRLPMKSTICVDFNLCAGNERYFLATTDAIRKDCRELDEIMQALPDYSFDMFEDWSSPGDLFGRPSAVPPNYEMLSETLSDINSDSLPFTRYEAAKLLKELCEHKSNRRAFSDTLRSEFVQSLESMLKDHDEDIVRFGIYTILNFREDLTVLKGLELPSLPDTLQQISSLSRKPSTRKLAGDLYNTLQAVC